jgi:hypothetical protein
VAVQDELRRISNKSIEFKRLYFLAAVDHEHHGTQQVLHAQDMLVLIIEGPMSLAQVVGNDHGKSETVDLFVALFHLPSTGDFIKFQDFSQLRSIQLRFFVGTQVVCQGQVKSENQK